MQLHPTGSPGRADAGRSPTTQRPIVSTSASTLCQDVTGDQEAVGLTADWSSQWSGVLASSAKRPLLLGTEGGTHLWATVHGPASGWRLPFRVGEAVADDAARQQVVLFGGAPGLQARWRGRPLPR